MITVLFITERDRFFLGGGGNYSNITLIFMQILFLNLLLTMLDSVVFHYNPNVVNQDNEQELTRVMDHS